MEAAKHRRLRDAVTGWQFVPVVTRRNPALVGLRDSGTE